MQDWQNNPNVNLLTDLPIPALNQDQINLFSYGSIHAQQAGPFNNATAVEVLKQKEGERVLSADFGGDKGSVRLFEVQNGQLEIVDDYSDDIQGNDGAGYVDCLKRAATYADAHTVRLGISWGGPMDGSKVLFHPKAKLFMKELEEQFASDLAHISPLVTALNDGPAGLISAAVAAYRLYQATTILFAINGGGFGMAVLKDGIMYAIEPGHVEAVRALNRYHQTSPCGVYDATYTCIEQLGANKAGIEVQWQTAHNGEYLRARDIEDRYKVGDTLAGELYDNSVLMYAHMIQGTATVFEINPAASNTAVACHGGALKFPYYGERLQQILTEANHGPTQVILTKDYVLEGSNACLDGAAIAALTAS